MEKFLIFVFNAAFICWAIFFGCLDNEQFTIIATNTGRLFIVLLPYIIAGVVAVCIKRKEAKEK